MHFHAMHIAWTQLGIQEHEGKQYHGVSHLQPAFEHMLLCVVETIAGADVARYVYKFLRDQDDQMLFPKWPGFHVQE